MAQTPVLQIKPTNRGKGNWDLYELFLNDKCIHKGYILSKEDNTYSAEYGDFFDEDKVYNLIKPIPVAELPDHLFLAIPTHHKFLNCVNYYIQFERQGKRLMIDFAVDLDFKASPPFLWNPILFFNTFKKHLPKKVFQPLEDIDTLDDGDGLHLFLQREVKLSGTIQTNVEEGIKIIDKAAKRTEVELIAMVKATR